jgi:hypothetical protein
MKNLGLWFKKNWIHFAMIALLYVIAAVYFGPVFEDQAITQGDVTNWIGSSKDIQDHRDAYEEEPLWSTGSFLGMSSENISMKQKGDVMTVVLKIMAFGLPAPANYLFLAFLSFYIMMICFKVKPWVAVLGAIAFGFSSYFIVILEAGHNTKALAIAFMPAVFGGAYQALRGKLWLGLGISALFMALQIYANHPQISYYLGMALAFAFLVELISVITKSIKDKTIVRAKKFLFGALGLLFAYSLSIGVNYGRLSMIMDASEYTTRGPSDLTIKPDLKDLEQNATTGLTTEYITQWSYGRDETFTLVIPNAKGGESGAIANDKELMKKAKDLKLKNVRKNAGQMRLMTYWGDQPFTSGPVYFGALLVVLAFLALVYVRNPWKWGVLSIAVLTTMLSWGSNFIGLSDYLMLQLVILFAAIAWHVSNNKVKYVLYGVSGLVFIITAATWGSSGLGLTDFFIESVPMYNKFRAITMILSIGSMCIPLLATMFIAEIAKDREVIAKKPMGLWIVSGAAVIFFISFIVSPDTFVDLYSQAEYGQMDQVDALMLDLDKYAPDQQAQIKDMSDTWTELGEFRGSVAGDDAKRSLIFVILGLAIVFIAVQFKKIKPVFVLPVLGLLFLIDLTGVDKRYLNNDKDPKNSKEYAQWIGVDQKQYPLSAYPMDKDIMEMEMKANPELAEKIQKAEKEAKKDAEDMTLGRVKRSAGGRSQTIDYTQNYIDAMKFGVLDLNTNYRVLDMTAGFTQSSRASYFHKSFGGYHGAKPRRWQEMVDFHMSKTLAPEILNMSNVKYIIQQPSQENPKGLTENRGNLGAVWLVKSLKKVPTANDEIKSLSALYEIEDLSGRNTLIVNGEHVNKAEVTASMLVELNEDTLQKAFQLPFNRMISAIRDEVILGSDSSQADVVLPNTYFKETGLSGLSPKHIRIKRIHSFDPANEAIINEKFASNLTKEQFSGNGVVEMESFKANELKYTFSSTEPQFAVFSELYHPIGWEAKIDGEKVEINQVNFLLRGLEIPAGEHEIVFTYEIPKYNSAGMLTGTLGVIVVLLFLFGIIYTQMKSVKDEEKLEA